MKLPPLPELPEPVMCEDANDSGDPLALRCFYTADQVNALLESYGRAVQQECARFVRSKHAEIEDMPSLAADMLYSAIRSTE